MKKRAFALILCIVICIGILPSVVLAAPRDISFEETLATDLKGLGLFKGVSDTNFDLNRAPSRIEALVMLIRVLGKESEALNGRWNHPFTDVDPWADKYVGYAYQKGLTNGISATHFGTATAGSNMYLTFVLRALGYSDVNGADFTWESPYVLAKSIGILPDCVNTSSFWRADVVIVSYAALPVSLKGSLQTLAHKLIAAGVFTQAQYNTYYDADAVADYEESKGEVKTELTAREISDKASSSVFYIEVYGSQADYADGYALGTGSGFFISSDGVAATNYHVIENSFAATATTTDGSKYNIERVLYYDIYRDIAVIKLANRTLDGRYASSFPFLSMNSLSSVSNGDPVYALGSPLGLQNSISNGIVGNKSRIVDDSAYPYIQTTAPISPGSSGGALLNAYGEVIGITTASYVYGQNLNLAITMDSIINMNLNTQGYKYADVYGNEFRKQLSAQWAAIGERFCYEEYIYENVNYEPISSGCTMIGSFSNPQNLDFYYFTIPIPVYISIEAGGFSNYDYDPWLDTYAMNNYGITWNEHVLDSFLMTIDVYPGETFIEGLYELDSYGEPVRVINRVRLEPGTYYICAYQYLDDDDAWADREYFVYLSLEAA